MHFYGQARWLGKSRIGGWCSVVVDAMSMKQRNQLAAFVTYVKDFHSRSMSAVSVMKRKARVVTKKAVVKAMGTPVWYKGKRYPSIRQAAQHNKISRKVIERVVENRLSIPACKDASLLLFICNILRTICSLFDRTQHLMLCILRNASVCDSEIWET